MAVGVDSSDTGASIELVRFNLLCDQGSSPGFSLNVLKFEVSRVPETFGLIGGV